jgi:organic radical activating enzyme
MKNLKYFCSHLFTSLSFDHMGQVRVCCNNYEIPTGEDLEPIDVYSEDFNVAEAFNSDLHIRIRQNILQGKQDESCSRCWQTEDNGAESYRTILNSTLSGGYLKGIMLDSVDEEGVINKPFITFLDFTMGNKCNLVCRMCNLNNSNQWDLESDLLNIEIPWDFPSTTLPVDEKFLEDEFFMKNFMHLKHINFLGGEPLIVDEHYEFLKKCIKFEVAQNIVLSYTTNLTVIKKELMGLWENFRHISVGVSVDGVEKVNDYIRYPSKWKNIQKNVEKISTFKDNISMDLQIHSTFQLLNVFDYDKLLEWTFSLGDLGFWRLPFGNWVSYSEYYDAKLLPNNLKEVALEKINKFLDSKKDIIWDIGEQQWLGILKSNLKTLEESFDEDDEQKYFKTIKKYTKLLDLNRGQHIKDYIPELEKFIYE